MRSQRLILLTALIFVSQGLFAGEKWVSLFNGKNLSGWVQKSGNATYRVEDGCIVGEAVSKDQTNSVLCTRKNYGDFVLELDFKVDPRLFSGVHIRSVYAAKTTRMELSGVDLTIPAGRVYGDLVFIDPGPPKRWWRPTLYEQRWWTGGIYDEWRRLWLYPGSLGGDQNEFSRRIGQIFKTNDWNHFRIEAVGNSINTYLNGVLCAHIEDSLTSTGLIGLQVRTESRSDDRESIAGAQVRFKNIRLKSASPQSRLNAPAP